MSRIAVAESTKVCEETKLSYCQFLSELLEHNNLFAPKEFKIIVTLVKRLDYSMQNFNVAISLSELQQVSGLGKGSVLSALSQLEQLGLLQKISGKYDQEVAREIRRDIFQRPQKRTRSYNEVNIYNLSGLYSFIEEVTELNEKAGELFFATYGYRLKPIDYPSRILPKLRRHLYREFQKRGEKRDFTYHDLLDLLRKKLDQSDCANFDLSNWSNLDLSDFLLLDQEPISKKEKPTDNTHTTKEQRLEKEKKTVSQDVASQQVKQKTKATQSVKPFDRIKNEEFRQFIIDYLESSPNIENPMAVAKSLSAQDIEYYYKLYRKYKQTQRENVQEKAQEQKEKQEGNKELLQELLSFASALFEKGTESFIYQKFFRDGIKSVIEDSDRIVIVCSEYVDQYLEREFGAKIRKWAGKPVEFTT